MPEIALTVSGNLTADPELRFTPSGAAVASFTVASTPRYFDKNTQEWKDGDATFVRCSVWRQQAENVAESMRRGQRVVVTGTLRQQNWEDNDGNKRSRLEMQCDEVAASMRFATVTATRKGGRSVEDSYDPGPEDPWGQDAPDAPEDEPADDAPAQPAAEERRERASRPAANGRQNAAQRRERATTRGR